MKSRPAERSVLTINCGSSSIKFALFDVVAGSPSRRIIDGEIARIGLRDTTLTVRDVDRTKNLSRRIRAADHAQAAATLTELLDRTSRDMPLGAIGHRVVQGGPKYHEPRLITKKVLSDLRRLIPLDPEHLPSEILLIEVLGRRLPGLPQVACFDTAFHHDLPRVARILPIPRRFEARGARRYGFHGISYAFLMEELARLADPSAATGRVILCHLGNGASLAAVRAGKSVDTSMCLTPAAGLPMSTRSGDIDPGLLSYLARTEKMSITKFQDMVNFRSGLIGISETSSDMRDLLALETKDTRAAEAVALFCYQVKKWIGAYAAALGGLDTLVFAGGIGENSDVVRARVSEGLEFLGIVLDPKRNEANEGVISGDSSRVTVRVIHTDEELMIARTVYSILGIGGGNRPRG